MNNKDEGLAVSLFASRTVGIPNYPRGSYSEYPMHSGNQHDKL